MHTVLLPGSKWHRGEVLTAVTKEGPAGGSLCLAVLPALAGTRGCSADTGLLLCPPPPAFLRKPHVVWKLGVVFCVYETTPKSLRRGLVFTHKLDGL